MSRAAAVQRTALVVAAAVAALLVARCGSATSPFGGSGGPSPGFVGPGPWGLDDRRYGAAEGILEQPVVGVSTDEAQNLWVATHNGLYLLAPGQKVFRRFDARDGLHLQGNPVRYCDADFAGGDRSCPIYGAAADPGILEITGGSANEVFVGYAGNENGPADWSDLNRHSGKLDRVRLRADGTLQVDRMDFVSTNTPQFWHDRTVHRLLYDRFLHPHELYVGTNHGVVRILPDRYRAPDKGEWFLKAYGEWMSDHLHPQVCFHRACDRTETGLRLGDWNGLALSADGNLWVAGRWTAGQIRWTEGLPEWLARPGTEIFAMAFGDPYSRSHCSGQDFCNQPVFVVDLEGDVVSIQAAAVAPDGRVWFASGRSIASDVPRGLAAWDGKVFRYYDPVRDAGLPEADIRDLLALPDGRLVLATRASGLMLWNPATSARTRIAAPTLPDDHVLRLELDRMVDPPVLHVATYGGAAALRRF